MLTLRFARAGTKKKPVFHVVATNSRNTRDGRFIEKLGYYVPAKKVLVINNERVDYWLKQGATTSETVGNVIKRAKRTAAANTVAVVAPNTVAVVAANTVAVADATTVAVPDSNTVAVPAVNTVAVAGS
ncbi:MAG: 30S ribosomal protein S16 [Deltaproteobacteria bacterium]|nr:30S ribosomal protein S16 [Deltaproteobacteria bacterium]